MIDKEELKKEQKYLNGVQDVLEKQLEFLNNSLYDQEKNLHEASKYISSNFYDMDIEERGVTQEALHQLESGIIVLAETRDLKERQRKSPYFGRIDFCADDEIAAMAYYIGIAHIGAAEFPLPLVVDWRAPLSSMYYDYELGDAEYTAPSGSIKGEVFLKRQYKTEGRSLVYAFDSNLTIGDEILQGVLGSAASPKMKNIVATIQSEQNKIIRASAGESLIVQGVAGSGKTSVALHRVAYLLYTNHIKASDILIVSPSSLFSDYISNVLPELGEANTPKITFEEIAAAELDHIVRFEPKSQMLDAVISGKSPLRARHVQTKATFEFRDALRAFLAQKAVSDFRAKDIKMPGATIKKEEIQKLFDDTYKAKTPAVRIEWIADYIVDRMELTGNSAKGVYERTKRVLMGFFKTTNIVSIYEDFLKTQNMALDKVKIGKAIYVGFEDVPALLYIKNYLLGVETHKHFKHVIIDEMQDYSPLAMELLHIIYPATKTVLGDVAQTLEKTLDKTYLKKMSALIGGAKIVNMSTTYRSTMQIAKYSAKILGLKATKMFNREGEPVQIEKGLGRIWKIAEKEAKKYQSVAIICPSQEKCKEVFECLDDKGGFVLVDSASGEVKDRKVVIAVPMTKGLEFDSVIFVEDKTGQKIDKNIKYVATTRALHSLTVVEM